MNIFFARTDMYGGLIEGGTFSLMSGFLKGINELGHNSAMLSSGPMNVPDGTNLHVIPYSSWFWNVPELPTIPYSYHFVRKAAAIFRTTPPEFLYLRHTAFNLVGALMRKELGIKVLLQCDSSEVWVKKNWGKNYFPTLLRWCEEIEFAGANGLTVISEEVKKQLIEMGASPEKILVNVNGVDTDMFSPYLSGERIRKHYGLETSFVCGFSGSFDVYHGVDVLASAMREIKASIPSVKFLYIGDGKMRGKVEEIMRKTQMEADVIFTGLIPHSSVPEHLAACDALFVPVVHNSDGSEFFGSPTKLFEYMAMQKPIIASAVGQLRLILQHDTNALLVPPNEPGAIAEQTIRLYRSSEFAGRIAAQAREDAVRHYQWKMNAQRVIDFTAIR
jgi:glycosyltransferase involved in cell wall biosynthesis